MLVLSHLLLSVAQAAQPLPASMWDEWFTDTDAGLVRARIHYPATSSDYGADPAGGDYPVIVFMHGYLGAAWMYTEACSELAGQGYVVINLDTEVGPWIDTDRLALDAQAALHWLESASGDADHWLSGMAADGDWIGMGHSFGGIALARLVSLEPRVQTVVGFMPYTPHSDEHDDYADFEGRALFLGGTEDETSTPEMVEGWFDALTLPSQGLHYTIDGAGHQAVSDFEWQTESMPDLEQRQVVLSLASDFLAARYERLICALPAEMTMQQSQSTEPITWTLPSSEQVVQLGLAGELGAQAVIYAGRGPGETLTDDGTILLRDAAPIASIALNDGLACADVVLAESLSGIGWLQVAFVGAGGTTLGEAIDVFGAGDPGPAAEDDSGLLSGSREDRTPGGSAPVASESAAISARGCTTAAAPTGLYLLVVGLLGLRRRL